MSIDEDSGYIEAKERFLEHISRPGLKSSYSKVTLDFITESYVLR